MPFRHSPGFQDLQDYELVSIYSIAKDAGLPLTKNIGRQVSSPENPCSDIIHVGGRVAHPTYENVRSEDGRGNLAPTLV